MGETSAVGVVDRKGIVEQCLVVEVGVKENAGTEREEAITGCGPCTAISASPVLFLASTPPRAKDPTCDQAKKTVIFFQRQTVKRRSKRQSQRTPWYPEISTIDKFYKNCTRARFVILTLQLPRFAGSASAIFV